MSALDREVDRVLRRDTCSGCGACTLLDPGLEMARDQDGYLRPVRREPSTLTAAEDRVAARRFRAACPGSRVDAVRPRGVPRHPVVGPVLGVWRAWAADDATRFRGSSGGTLSALAGWLTETGEAVQVLGAAAAPSEPRRTVPVRITTREEALAAAGSRYAPVAVGSAPDALTPGGAVVGKPCEASALRSLTARDPDGPLLLSFFCAGTPSQDATETLVAELATGIGLAADEPLSALHYRGQGWPGRFTARSARTGAEASMSYEESWGRRLGPTVQWRCKICPDGVGESSDVTAADFWDTDERGYPVFDEGAGISALIARTPRGLDLVRRAVEAGVLVAEPLTAEEVAGVQPYHRRRRSTLVGRLVGTVLAGRGVPRYRGFALTRLALRVPRDTLRMARGSFRRVRAARRATPSATVQVPTTESAR